MKKIVANNPTARHNYTIEDTYEAGIVLTGTEIKSIRNGKVNLKDSYANIKNGEVFIYGMHISPYEHGNIYNKDPLRTRKLLLNRREINKLTGLIKQKGLDRRAARTSGIQFQRQNAHVSCKRKRRGGMADG